MKDVPPRLHRLTALSLSRRRLMVGGAAIAFAGSAGIGPVGAQTPKPMRVGVHKGVVFVPALLLQSILGAEWKVELSYFGSPADMANAIASHSIDIGYTGVTIAAIARSKGCRSFLLRVRRARAQPSLWGPKRPFIKWRT